LKTSVGVAEAEAVVKPMLLSLLSLFRPLDRVAKANQLEKSVQPDRSRRRNVVAVAKELGMSAFQP
tara:strand:+ start:829 stop:1026 length:198 start_codon:yes stop_codon:yes gene_type:complete